MAFVAAMNSPDTTKSGVKGSDVYTEEGVGDLRVTFFTQLVRGLSKHEIERNVDLILAKGKDYVRDLIVMAFQTRDIRGGKGERALFYKIFTQILNTKDTWAKHLLELVPEYGCWRDLWEIYPSFNNTVSKEADKVVLERFQLDQESQHPSLLVKWLPREGSKYDNLARRFAGLFFPTVPTAGGQQLRQYRKTLAYLNKLCDTTEIKMCANTWADIEPSHVPGRLMKRCKSAFFNQKKGPHSSTVTRYPGNADREACAENFKGLLNDVKEGKTVMKGGQTTMPHEHVAEIQKSFYHPESQEVEDTRQAQWDAIRAETLKAGGLGKIVPMCDFSGSMDGTPKEVSLALGILISEVASPAFRDHILTFDSTPKWHSFSGQKTLREKVVSVGNLGQGLSTDFQAACDLVLKKLVENNVAPEDAPTDLLVLTDMGFDAACASNQQSYYTGNSYSHNTKNKTWETHFQMIRSNFEKHGYQPPRIVCWNLRAEYKDYFARADEVGVVQLSGWSPAVLKAIQGNGIVVETPYGGMRRILDDTRYDRVREIVDSLQRLEAVSLVRDA
jgi:hypothetical protein